MALDSQRNWDVQMAENLQKLQLGSLDDHPGTPSQQKRDSICPLNPKSLGTSNACSGREVHLPDEIILHILSYLSLFHKARKDLLTTCQLSRQWYQASVPLLYERPFLYGKNFDPFVRSICPSINLHVRKSPLSQLVKVLDMGNLVHHGSRSLTARLLGRVKAQLEAFIAPQASFAVNCLPALAKCRRLTLLDLSLVSESPPLPELFRCVANIPELKTFKLPRSAGFGQSDSDTVHQLAWPPRLENVSLSGGIDRNFLRGVMTFPQTLKSVALEHCPLAKGSLIVELIKTVVRPIRGLESFRIANMPRLSSHAMDDILCLLPQIKHLSISVDYITPAVFDDMHVDHSKDPVLDGHPTLAGWPSTASDVDRLPQTSALPHGLRSLELTNSGNPGVEDKVTPIDIIIAIDQGTLAKLRQVRNAKTLRWSFSPELADAQALTDALQEGSKRDWESREWIFAEMKDSRYYQDKIWKQVAGVWEFDG